MKKTTETVAELQARRTSVETEIAVLRSKDDAVSKAQLEARNTTLESIADKILMAEKDEHYAALDAANTARIEADADNAVQRMVAGGQIPPQDTKKMSELRASFIKDPTWIKTMESFNAPPGGNLVVAGRQTPNAAAIDARGGFEQKFGAMDVSGALKAIGALSASSGKGMDLGPKFKAALEIGAAYKQQIQPLFAAEMKRGSVPTFELQAATTADGIGTLAGTLVALRTLDLYKYEFPMLDTITTDFSDQPAQFNQTTTTRIIVVPAVLSYDATLGGDGRPAGWTIVTQAQTVDASITLNRHRATDIIFDANTLASTQRRLFEEQGPACAYALGKDVVDYIYTLITFANFGNNAGDNSPFAVTSTNYGRPAFSKAKRLLNVAGAPFTNRFALSNSVYQEMLEQDPTLVSLAVYQKPEIITDSELPPIARFRPIEAPNLPATAITGFGALAAFFAHKSALLIQARIPNDWNTVLGGNMSYGSVNVVTNPDTGLSVLMVQFSNPQSSHAEYRLALMYGAAKGNSKGGVIVTT